MPSHKPAKKPQKLSLADFHAQVDGKLQPPAKAMPVSAEKQSPLARWGLVSRGRGVCNVPAPTRPRNQQLFFGATPKKNASKETANAVEAAKEIGRKSEESAKAKAGKSEESAKAKAGKSEESAKAKAKKSEESVKVKAGKSEESAKANTGKPPKKNPNKSPNNEGQPARGVLTETATNSRKKKSSTNADKKPPNTKKGENKITILKRPSEEARKAGLRPCHPIPIPQRDVPEELKQLDSMTSADYRNDINAHLDNMRIQLKDQLHMRYLASAISQNLHLFKDKVILVLCCGPGTLALMAAKAGASIVYAVDYSLATGYAQLVVKQNGYEDIIQVMMGRMADLKLPQKVDGIVCNWMGQSLLLDSEILEVLQARDRWLNEDGFILPDVGSLYLLGSQETLLKNDRCNWWLNVYGFPMGVMRKCALAEPRYVKASGDKLITLAHKILRLDLKTATIDDLCIDRKFRLQVQREDRLDCFVLYFDVEFSRSHTRHWFSCNPCLDPIQKSMWLQTVIFVDHPFVMREKLFYTGHFKFAPLKPQCMKNMEMRMQLYESQKNDDKRDRAYCRRVVAKRWLMVECFHTLKDVESCQDEQESELSNF